MAEESEPRTRRETVQRVQVGLIGLGAVLLVVGFANIVVKAVRQDATQPFTTTGDQPEVATAANGTAPGGADSEPLADLGVAPKSDQPADAVRPSVPDLEPDPRLSKPMDRDPKKSGTAPQR